MTTSKLHINKQEMTATALPSGCHALAYKNSIYNKENNYDKENNQTYCNLKVKIHNNIIIIDKKYFNDNNINKYLEIGISVICLAIYTLLLNKYPGWYGIDSAKSLVLHQLGAICGVYVYYVIAKYLCKIKLFGDVSVYGKYSYEIYLVHVYLIRIITPYVSKVSEINFYSISFVVIYALTFALGSLGVTILLTKNKYINLALFGNYKPLLIKKDTKSLN